MDSFRYRISGGVISSVNTDGEQYYCYCYCYCDEGGGVKINEMKLVNDFTGPRTADHGTR
jgi:hypothetical protein